MNLAFSRFVPLHLITQMCCELAANLQYFLSIQYSLPEVSAAVLPLLILPVLLVITVVLEHLLIMLCKTQITLQALPLSLLAQRITASAVSIPIYTLQEKFACELKYKHW